MHRERRSSDLLRPGPAQDLMQALGHQKGDGNACWARQRETMQRGWRQMPDRGLSPGSPEQEPQLQRGALASAGSVVTSLPGAAWGEMTER